MLERFNDKFPKKPKGKEVRFSNTFAPNNSTMVFFIPRPLVFKTSFSLFKRVIDTFGLASASKRTASFIALNSVASFFKNFSRAGVLKNKSFTSISVPISLVTSYTPVIFPPLDVKPLPISLSLSLEVILNLETELIEDKASPLNPYVIILKRSSFLEILLVACLSTERSKSSLDIPLPLSEIFTYLLLFFIFITILVLLASIEFSNNSFIMLAGFSTTSPAAIILETFSSRILIFPISSSIKKICYFNYTSY